MRKVVLALSLIFVACSGGPSPKDAVFEFIDAVKSDDSLKIAQILDIDSYIRLRMSEMSPEDSANVLEEYRAKTFQSLLGDGEIRKRFLHDLIVVNTEARQDSIADVEVSFIDRQTRIQLYTKMLLRRQADHTWRIISFK
jgi:hypothetical protein